MLNRIRWNSYTCTCFLSSQCPRKIVTLGWPRFLEGLAKHLDICYLGRGTWLLRTNLSNLGLSGLRLRPFSLGPRSSCWPCPPRSLAFFFGGIFTSLTDFILKFYILLKSTLFLQMPLNVSRRTVIENIIPHFI